MTSVTGMLTGRITPAVVQDMVVLRPAPRRGALTSPPPPGISQRLVLITLMVSTLVVIFLVLHSPGGVL